MSESPSTIVLYDGMCSACSASAAKLRKLDGGRGRLELVDLRQETDLLEAHGLSASEIRRVMHTITPDGRVHLAMDALRVTMSAIGRGWMLGWTTLPGIRWATDRLYLWFAKNRLRWFAGSSCEDGVCAVDSESRSSSD